VPDLTFNAWLYRQRDRRDPVGDLASDAWADRRGRGRGKGPRTFEGWRRYLRSAHACDGALRALETAWTEWRELQAGGAS